jgi:geranylgeranyl diphosphate synthase type II
MNQRNAVSEHNITQLMGDVEVLMRHHVKNNNAASYHLTCGGARVRAMGALDVGAALGLDHQSAVTLASTVEMLHNASLMHDDLQDNDPDRRGHEAVWSKFGDSAAICAGDLLIAKAFGELANISTPNVLPKLLRHVQEAVSLTIAGQCKDIDSQNIKTLAGYEEIAAEKSGPLLRLSLELPLIASGNEGSLEATQAAISYFAIAYQIADDLCDRENDRASDQLNIVNILAEDMTMDEAISLAKSRAQYLLRKCQAKLHLLPNNSGKIFIELAQNLMLKVKSYRYE